MKPHEKLGKEFRERRIEKGMTQSALSEKSGVTQCVISEFERGMKNITVDTMANLNKALER
jgi:transcriptional regulator with XRE-family HTH domain